MDLNTIWTERLKKIDFAFQPIVNIHTGAVYGFEALIRGTDACGFTNISDFFDAAYTDQILYKLDLELREIVVRKYVECIDIKGTKIFYNIDNRILEMPDYHPCNTKTLLDRYSVPGSHFVFEISEQHELLYNAHTAEILNHYKSQNYKIALDDYGSGYAGLRLLYHSDPHIIKIDRFFISFIDADIKKKLFISNIINMSHLMGITVVAEGVENENEYYACLDIGCDFVQGYLIQKPTTDMNELRRTYESMAIFTSRNKRSNTDDRKLISERMEKIPPLYNDTELWTLLDAFRKNKGMGIMPVINREGEPLGVIREEDLKHYLYSPFGKEILQNKIAGRSIDIFIQPCPMVEIRSTIDSILEMFSSQYNNEGLIVTEDGLFSGFLSAKSLLNIIYEKNLTIARNQNPLTKLNGNSVIAGYISQSLARDRIFKSFVYFDIDYFKPYNDRYGFRQGDRVILLLADILREIARSHPCFIGHIGGDDFFAGFDLVVYSNREVKEIVLDIIRRFSDGVKAFYDKDDLERGYILSKDREGNEKHFPFLTVSAVIVDVMESDKPILGDDLGQWIAEMKKYAKTSEDKLSTLLIDKELHSKPS